MNKGNCKHKLSDMLLLVILARACGCEATTVAESPASDSLCGSSPCRSCSVHKESSRYAVSTDAPGKYLAKR